LAKFFKRPVGRRREKDVGGSEGVGGCGRKKGRLALLDWVLGFSQKFWGFKKPKGGKGGILIF